MATGTRNCDPATARDLQKAIRSRLAGLGTSGGPLVLSFDLPDRFEPLRVWDAFPSGEATFWRSPDGLSNASTGRVAFVPAGPGTDPGRSAESLARLADDISHVDVDSGQACLEPIRLFGGAAFAATADRGEWEAFGEGGFVLPQLTIEEAGGGVRGRLVLDGSSVAENQSRASAWIEALLGGPGDRFEPDNENGPADHADRDASMTRANAIEKQSPDAGPVPEDWVQLVEAARDGIRSGKLRKVVVCRRRTVPLGGRRDPVPLLSGLASRQREYVFGLRRGDRTFLGASPELLMEKRENRLRTEALAGTCQLDPGIERTAALARAAEQLFGSGKDLEEHAIVVRGIVEALEPIALRRGLPPWPEVRGLTGLAHLCSVIDADLRPGLSPFETLAALHPTPAVGGLPRDAALRFLADTEPVERGWYAGPVGWVTPEGDAQIAVGIRSALLGPDRAWLYAGAGIVLASDPQAEYRETEAKLRRLSHALGVTEIPI
ncbi:MAG: chorismate-binding protein [marine benthic group bacterium]|nr:chorismate-binding protein [Gemmatimonadota bacterium]